MLNQFDSNGLKKYDFDNGYFCEYSITRLGYDPEKFDSFIRKIKYTLFSTKYYSHQTLEINGFSHTHHPMVYRFYDHQLIDEIHGEYFFSNHFDYHIIFNFHCIFMTKDHYFNKSSL